MSAWLNISDSKSSDSKSRRLTFLIIEVEPGAALSTRKLLIAASKHNVITAYTGQEGIETFKRFPNVNAVVIDSQLRDMNCEEVTKRIKELDPNITVVALNPREELPKNACSSDRVVVAYDPADSAALLKLLEEISVEAGIE
ncbi:MAG: hypothetical protein JWO13_1093 [Acidobacteriales bacterium]|nr:hypothetical protein [Terriglobales bacterium]